MALVTLCDILHKADCSDYAIGSFNVLNMEMVIGTIKAAEDTHSPVIMQVAEPRLKHAPLQLIGPIMLAAANQAKVPVAVHLDHGSSISIIRQALELGFSSVMYDGSHLPLAANIARTNEVLQLARTYGASMEAEIGRVGGSEDNSQDIEMVVTQVKDAQRFFECTGVDALAVAIGNIHGIYKKEPNLQFGRLADLNQAVAAPLVLHGGSGISAADFRECIRLGIKKINVQTATLSRISSSITQLVQECETVDYFDLHQIMVDATYNSVKEHIAAFKSENRA